MTPLGRSSSTVLASACPRGLALLLAVSGVSFGSLRSARATPAEVFGAGAQGIALVGTGTSLELGPEAALVNPALLAGPDRSELAFGYRVTRFALDLDTAGAKRSYSVPLSRGLMLGASAPLSRRTLATGIGFYAESGPDVIVKATLPAAEVPHFPLLVGRSDSVDLGLAFGARYGPLSLGMGLRALASLAGTGHVESSSAGTRTAISTRLVPAWAPSAGAKLELGPAGRAGVAIRGVLRADFDVDVAGIALGPLGVVPLNVAGIAAYEPLRIDLEWSRSFGPLEAALGGRFERWSAFPGWAAATVECPPSRVSACAPAPPSPGYSDVVSPRVALRRRLALGSTALELRGGYTFVPSPVPEQRGVRRELDAARHGLGFGYRVELPERLVPLHLDAALRLDLLAPRTHRVSPGPSPLRTSGSVQTLALGLGVRL